MTKNSSRRRILEYLGQHNGATAVEISRVLRVTAANVRYHLSVLSGDGRVKALGSRQENGPGRPVIVYGLSEAALGDNLAGLVNGLFGLVMESGDQSKLEARLASLAAGLIPARKNPANEHITRRLAQTVAQLSQFGYSARWEAHAAAPRIIFEHCPYAAVIAKHPELCLVDKIMLEQRLDGKIEQTAKLEKNARGMLYCQFVLNQWQVEKP